MGFPSDIEIAQANKMEHIRDIASKLSLVEDNLEMYGKYKALYLPYISKLSSTKLSFEAISLICSILFACAISISEGKPIIIIYY